MPRRSRRRTRLQRARTAEQVCCARSLPRWQSSTQLSVSLSLAQLTEAVRQQAMADAEKRRKKAKGHGGEGEGGGSGDEGAWNGGVDGAAACLTMHGRLVTRREC